MSKLNKTQTANLVTATVKQIIEENIELFKKDKAPILEEELTKALHVVVGPKTGGGVTDKVNENGDVYCNYFDKYLDPSEFNTKKDGKYKANCKEAEKILRKLKTTRAAVERGATSDLRANIIDQDAWFAIMDKLDLFTATKYYDVSEVKWEEA